MDKRPDDNQDQHSGGLTPVQKGLLTHLRQKRTMLAACEYFQRHTPTAETPKDPWLDAMIEMLRTEVADLSRMLRLYDMPSAAVYTMRYQVDEARNSKDRGSRLTFLLTRSRAMMRWIEQELETHPPDDVAQLWTEFLAAEQQRVQQIEAMLTEAKAQATD